MIFINNVSHESGNKNTDSIQFFNLFPFYTKIKTSILPRVGIKKPVQKTWPHVVFFLIFPFLRYLKAFYINYGILIVIVLLNILACNSRKISVYTG